MFAPIHLEQATPRSDINSLVFENVEPEMFGNLLKKAIKIVAHNNPEEHIVFIKSWNEWAEGNYLEPSRKFGKSFLKVIKQEIAH